MGYSKQETIHIGKEKENFSFITFIIVIRFVFTCLSIFRLERRGSLMKRQQMSLCPNFEICIPRSRAEGIALPINA